jgi:hypothetical protein
MLAFAELQAGLGSTIKKFGKCLTFRRNAWRCVQSARRSNALSSCGLLLGASPCQIMTPTAGYMCKCCMSGLLSDCQSPTRAFREWIWRLTSARSSSVARCGRFGKRSEILRMMNSVVASNQRHNQYVSVVTLSRRWQRQWEVECFPFS